MGALAVVATSAKSASLDRSLSSSAARAFAMAPVTIEMSFDPGDAASGVPGVPFTSVPFGGLSAMDSLGVAGSMRSLAASSAAALR